MKREEIQKKILQYLRDLEWPSTTGDVARGIKVSWNTAELNLIKLQMQGKVKFKRVGRQNQWWINKSYKENMK
jgi:predicted transcriptional regulator